MINPMWLRSFCTLVEVGHFTRTAEQLHMTQSGVSQHVKKLEEHFAEPLLIRQGKRFTLTSAGERLYQEGRALLHGFADLDKRVSRDPTYEGYVSIASPGSVGLKLYAHLLGVQRRHPNLVIDYRFAPNSDVEALIAKRDVDLGLMTCAATRSEVQLTPIAKEALLLVTPAEYHSPQWQDLVALGFVNHPDGSYHASQLLSVNFVEFEHFSQLKIAGFSNQINLILEPVSLGLGFTVLPSYAVSAFRGKHKVRAHVLPHSVSEALFLGVHRSKYRANCVNTVMAEIEQCLQCDAE